MDDLLLIPPDESLLAEVQAYRNAMLAAGSSMDGCGGLQRYDHPAAWLSFFRQLTNEETLPEGWVPSTLLVCLRRSDRKIVGMIDMRHRFNEHLRLYGGHIGYSVCPDERRKGYATWMLQQATRYCRDALKMERVLVICLAENEASRRTILRCGGLYESTIHDAGENEWLERYWIALR